MEELPDAESTKMDKTVIESHMEKETMDDEDTIVGSVDASNDFYFDETYRDNQLTEEEYLQATLEATQKTVIEMKRQLDEQKKTFMEDRTHSQKELQMVMFSPSFSNRNGKSPQ